jgi:hypothetical protein
MRIASMYAGLCVPLSIGFTQTVGAGHAAGCHGHVRVHADGDEETSAPSGNRAVRIPHHRRLQRSREQ